MNSYKPLHVDKVDDKFSDSSNQLIIRSSFENQTTNAEEWIDPYDSVWLKILTFFVYIVEVMAASIMITFVYYETSGYAGHYRTLINQLLSYFYGGVIHADIINYRFLTSETSLKALYIYFIVCSQPHK